MGTRNKQIDLNNILFEQLERLNDEEYSGEQLEQEINRADAVVKVGKAIIENGRLLIDARKAFSSSEGILEEIHLPGVLEISNKR